MATVDALVALTAPLFALVALGYALARFGRGSPAASDALAGFVFSVAVPALLFRLMSGFPALPPVDPRLLVAYFGGAFVVYAAAIAVARGLFRHDGATASVFGMGAIFANTVLLGVPLVTVTLGERALPAITLVIVFNAWVLWMLVTISVEWARQRAPSTKALLRTAREVALNPIVAAIIAGTAFGFTGWTLPGFLDRTLALLADAAIPLSLVALGMSLSEYGVRNGWRESLAIAALKLVLHPLAVYALARSIGLSPVETQAVTVLAAMPVGANVYLMSKAFDTLGGPVAAAIVLSTAIAALTTPIVIALTGGASP
jgi:malonate transporter